MYVLKDLSDDTYITGLDTDDGWDYDDDPALALEWSSIADLLRAVGFYCETKGNIGPMNYGYTIVQRVPKPGYEEVVL